MKIFIICSKNFYPYVAEIKKALEDAGHIITLPNSYDDPDAEERYRNLGREEHAKWKASMLRHSSSVIVKNDAVLVLNFGKHGIKNYIGGATFLEMYDAFRFSKKIFMYNDIPEGILKDEIISFSPSIIKSNLKKII